MEEKNVDHCVVNIIIVLSAVRCVKKEMFVKSYVGI